MHKLVQMFWMKNRQNITARALRKPTKPTFASDVFPVFFATFSAADSSFIYCNATTITRDRLLTNINIAVTLRIEIQQIKSFEMIKKLNCNQLKADCFYP